MGIKHTVNEQFFDTWGDEMAYVLGYMFADGNLEYSPSIRGRYVRFVSIDLDRVMLIRKLMQSKHVLYSQDRPGNRKRIHLLKIGSHKLYNALLERNVTPRKSHTSIFPNVPEKYLAAFTLGYFDGDGCSFIGRSKNGNAKKLHCIFTSGSMVFLEILHKRLIASTGLLGKGLYRHGSNARAYQLRYATRDSIRIFMLMYKSDLLQKLALKRKYDIFMKYFEERNIGPKDFPSILTKKGPVAK